MNIINKKDNETDKIEVIKEKILNSSAINSLKDELSIYNKLSQLGWEVDHSPYYLDSISGKFREVDISARKYWLKVDDDKFSFGVNLLIECKSISNYHIVFCNKQEFECGLENDWIGNDKANKYSKTIELLKKHEINDNDIKEALKTFHKYLFPEGSIRHSDYLLNSFEMKSFCSFRETNIGNVRDLENSVVWKSYQSLYSIIRSYQANSFDGIDYSLYDIEKEDLISSYQSRLNQLKKSLIRVSNHFELFHPVLVVESMLWELKDDCIQDLKYCRLVFNEISGLNTWIDIVDFRYLDEYFAKANTYDSFFIEKGFEKF